MGIEEISMVRNRCTAKCQKGAERARQKHALRYKYNKQAQSANFSKLSLKKKEKNSANIRPDRKIPVF